MENQGNQPGRRKGKAPLSALFPNFTRCKFQKECSRTLAHKLEMHFSLEINTSSRTLASILCQSADQICLSVSTLDLVFHQTMNTYGQFLEELLWLQNIVIGLICNHHYSWKPSVDMNQYRAVPSRKFFRFIS